MSARPPLLLLTHRIPYPPNKGDKIRSFNLLRFLATHYAVHLGAFVDDPDDWRHADTLTTWCISHRLVALQPRRARLRSLRGLLTGEALTLPYYASPELRAWVEATLRETGAQRLVVFSAAMAQYAEGLGPGVRCLLDLVDVDSEKWRQYGERRRGPLGWIYRREARCLRAYEARASRTCAATLLVSAAEAALFRERCPDGAPPTVVANGIDTGYFRPDPAHGDPYPAGTRALTFTGAMDYWPNIDAVCWFAEAVLPAIRARHPDAVFHIVGARPAPAVERLARRPGIRVVGPVADMRPWLQHAALLVAPLRIARGIQNKVLEGFAMARPVLTTSEALAGIDAGTDYPLAAQTPAELARLAGEVLAGRIDPELGPRLRARVRADCAWPTRLAVLHGLLETPAQAVADTTAAPSRPLLEVGSP